MPWLPPECWIDPMSITQCQTNIIQIKSKSGNNKDRETPGFSVKNVQLDTQNVVYQNNSITEINVNKKLIEQKVNLCKSRTNFDYKPRRKRYQRRQIPHMDFIIDNQSEDSESESEGETEDISVKKTKTKVKRVRK
jgi:hypothetical protein